MVDENRSNLEPLDDNDLDLKDKFTGGGMPQERMPEPMEVPKIGVEAEIPPQPEQIPEQSLEQSRERKEGAAETDDSYAKILSKVTTAAPPQDDAVPDDAEIASKEQDAEGKINSLVSLAEVKGVPHAVKVARHMQDNYLLDEFHDRLLSDELHDALIKKGLIKEV